MKPGRKPRPCPDVEELRKLLSEGAGMMQLCKHYNAHSKAIHRWLREHKLGKPRSRIASLPGEIWKPVLGWEGRYEVSNKGRVKSLDRIGHNDRPILGRILKPYKSRKECPYWLVNLCRDGRRELGGHMARPTVHKLVLEAFVGPRPDGMEACHNNGDGLDNRLENLRWDTPTNNSMDRIQHGTQHRIISIELATEIVRMTKTGTRRERKEIARHLGIPTKYVWRVTRGPNFKYLRQGE